MLNLTQLLIVLCNNLAYSKAYLRLLPSFHQTHDQPSPLKWQSIVTSLLSTSAARSVVLQLTLALMVTVLRIPPTFSIQISETTIRWLAGGQAVVSIGATRSSSCPGPHWWVDIVIIPAIANHIAATEQSQFVGGFAQGTTRKEKTETACYATSPARFP